MTARAPELDFSMTRRGALLAAIASSEMACRSGGGGEASLGAAPSASITGASSSPRGPEGFASGGLEVATLDRMQQGEHGGTAVVLLHGWGASGTDLVPLARAFARPKVRFFVPAGPLSEQGGGRAWWHLGPDDRPAHALTDVPPPGYQPRASVSAARSAVQALLRSIKTRHAPDALLIAGFSQGAMLSLDLALSADPPVERVAVLSGVLLVDSLTALLAPRSTRPRVFMAHGGHDPVLPFATGERAKDLLTKHGYDVTWRPFDGGHEITPAIASDLAEFLFDGA